MARSKTTVAAGSATVPIAGLVLVKFFRNKFILAAVFLLMLSVFSLCHPRLCHPQENAPASGMFRIAMGYCFLSQTDDIKDTYKHLLRAEGRDADVFGTSLGVKCEPYYQFKNGIRAGASAGPLILIAGDSHHFQVPLNLSMGYSFFQDAPVSGYLKCGISWHAATGDYVAHSAPGFYGGAGCEILNHKPVHIGIEIMYDAATVSLDRPRGASGHKKIQTGEVTVFLYADF